MSGQAEAVAVLTAPQTKTFEKVVVVLPAYNAERTLRQTVDDIPDGVVDEILLVDDYSHDQTLKVGEELGLQTIRHYVNRGYGANQKTCYVAALESGADLIIMLHPDYQYDPRLIPYFLGFMEAGICDVMLGSRIRTRREALEGGMPCYKYLSNRILTFVENLVLGQNLGDFHSGFRMYRREVLEAIPFEMNSDDFVFDSEFLAQVVYFGFKIGDAPMPVRYFPEASSINFRRSLTYGLKTLAVLGRFVLQKLRLAKLASFRRKDSL